VTPRIPLPKPFDQHPFRYRDARDGGVGEGRLRGSDLSRPFHGVRNAGRDDIDLVSLCRAFQTKMPPNGFFSSITAAQLMRIPLPGRVTMSSRIHVAVVAPQRGIEDRRVIGHKVQLMGGDSWDWDGLRISTAARAWCELGRSLHVPELVAAGDYIVHWRYPLQSLEELADAVGRYPDRRGRPRLRAASGLLNDRSESPKESELRVLLHVAGVVGVVANLPVQVGSDHYRLDLAIPNRKVAIEYHGDYHRDPVQWRRDLTRKSRLESAGWFVIEVNADDLRNPRELIARIRRVLETRPYFP
jgi:very-short-patch-repair endonuclease